MPELVDGLVTTHYLFCFKLCLIDGLVSCNSIPFVVTDGHDQAVEVSDGLFHVFRWSAETHRLLVGMQS